MKINGKLILYFALVILLVSMGLGGISYYFASNTIVNETELTLQQKAIDIAKLIEARTKAPLKELEAIASRTEIVSMDWEVQKGVLEKEIQRTGYLTLAVVTPDGVARYIDGNTAELGDRDYVIEAFNGNSNISDVIISRVTDSAVVMCAAPIRSEGQIVGVLVARMDGTELSNLIGDVTYGLTGYAYVINNEGTIIAHDNRDYVMEQINIIEKGSTDENWVSLSNLVKYMMAGENGFGEYALNGESFYLGYAPVEGTVWSVGVTAPKNEVLSSLPILHRTIFLTSLAFVGLGITIAFFLGRTISKPLVLAAKQCEEMAKGNFTKVLGKEWTNRKDEIGALARGFNNIALNVSVIGKKLNETAEQTSSSSEELSAIAEETTGVADHIANSAQEVASSAEIQLMSVENTSAIMEEISAGVQSIAENANSAANLSQETVNITKEGQKAIDLTIEQMNYINSSTKEVRTAIIGVTDSANQINEIVNVINNIADQTNLLALNAAIEAARAGNAGKGFAVVADEIRKLAEQSVEATQKIAKIINENQISINNANSTMEMEMKNVENGIKIANSAGEKFEQIMSLVSKVSDQIRGISSSIQQMASKNQDLVSAIENIDTASKNVTEQIQSISSATEEQSASMEEIAAASQDLAKMAAELTDAISKFKVAN